MAPYGKAWKGKTEARKEMSLIGLAHRTAYVMQGSLANITHLLEGFIDGLSSRRPALFNVYAVCQPEHGVADDATFVQSKLALEGRAYPLLKFDPDAGETLEECLDIEGNPDLDEDWPSYGLKYLDEKGGEQSLEVPMTFADFAVTEARFRKHFRKAPPETWNDNMLPLHEFLDLQSEDREGRFPFIWGVDQKNRLMRVLVSAELVRSCEERRQFWRQLKSLAGQYKRVDVAAMVEQAKRDMAQKLTASLLAMATGGGFGKLSDLPPLPSPGGNGQGALAQGGSGGWEPVWVDTPECTACDECMKINPKIFAYNGEKKTIILDPKGGPYKDIVKAAEKCTAGCIHPGTPWNPVEKDVDKLLQRAQKYQ